MNIVSSIIHHIVMGIYITFMNYKEYNNERGGVYVYHESDQSDREGILIVDSLSVMARGSTQPCITIFPGTQNGSQHNDTMINMFIVSFV